MSEELLIYNGKVLTEDRTIENGYVYIRDGRIASIGENWQRFSGVESKDAAGLIIAPGYIDMHTHGIKDVDFMEADAGACVRALREYTAFGVTRVVASTLANPFDNIIQQAQRFREAQGAPLYGAVLHGMHMEGPWIAERCRGGHAREYLTEPTQEAVERLLRETGGVLKTVTLAPELPNSVQAIERLSENGVIVSIGHSEASYEDAERAILAGARHGTHLYDTNLGYKENPEEALVMMPGHETAMLMNDDFSVELIGCPVHVPKPFFRFINKVKPRRKKVIVTDSLVGTGMKDGTVLTYKDGRKVYVSENVLRMIDEDPKVDGNLTGSAVTMNVAIRRLVEYTGLPLFEAIRWGTLNPATTLGVDNETGSIRVGKWADVQLMDEEFNVTATFVKGVAAFDAGREREK